MGRKPTNSVKGAASPTHKAYIGIRRMLFNNEIVPGQKIAYNALAEHMQMSPTPVVHALKLLEVQGLVRHEANKGYYTEPISIEEAEDIYDFRIIVERSIIEKTIQNLNAKNLKKIKTAYEAHCQARRAPHLNEWLLKDMDFHLTLGELSGSKIQLFTLRHLFDVLYLKYRGTLLFLIYRPREEVYTEHKAIVEAVAAGDIPQAQEAVTRHLQEIKRHVVLVLKEVIEQNSSIEF